MDCNKKSYYVAIYKEDFPMENGIRISAKVIPGEYIRIRKILPDKTKIDTHYEFKEVTRKAAAQMRLKNVPYCVLRLEDKIYIAILPKEYLKIPLQLRNDALAHRCDKCKFCHALPASKGGCEKVKDRLLEAITTQTLEKLKCDLQNKTTEEQKKIKSRFIDSLNESMRLEKYPFITYGFETVHVPNEMLIVSTCSRFIVDEPRLFSYAPPVEKKPKKIPFTFSPLYKGLFSDEITENSI